MNRREALALLGYEGADVPEEIADWFDQVVFDHRAELVRDPGRLVWQTARRSKIERLVQAERVLELNKEIPRDQTWSIDLDAGDPLSFLRNYEAVTCNLKLIISRATTFSELLQPVDSWIDLLSKYKELFPKIFGSWIQPVEESVVQNDAMNTAEVIALLNRSETSERLILLVSREWKRLQAWP